MKNSKKDSKQMLFEMMQKVGGMPLREGEDNVDWNEIYGNLDTEEYIENERIHLSDLEKKEILKRIKAIKKEFEGANYSLKEKPHLLREWLSILKELILDFKGKIDRNDFSDSYRKIGKYYVNKFENDFEIFYKHWKNKVY